MINPIFSSGRAVAFYSIPWIVVMALHSILLYYSYHLGMLIAVADALIFNAVFAIMGASLWYVVQYNPVGDKLSARLAFNHLVIAIVFIAIWYLISVLLASAVIGNREAYESFAKETLLWRLAFGFIMYMVLLLAYYAFKIYDELKQKELQQAQIKNYLREAELKSLKAQLNPHFIFNSLNSINALTITSPEKAREMVVKLSEFLRYSLKRGSETDIAGLSEELENARRYLDIEKVRFGKNLVYQEEIVGECLHIKIPIYILQPLLENAIKHGVYDSINPVHIKLVCNANGEDLAITIANDIASDNAKPGKGEGIGLKNIRSRLKLIYGNENLMKIEKSDNQFIVSLSLPKIFNR